MSRKLETRLHLWFDRSQEALPAELSILVDRHFDIFRWNELTPEQRRSRAQCVDAQQPDNLADRAAAAQSFLEGFKKVSVPQRNSRNAKKPRPSRQQISDADILHVMRTLETEGVPKHKQCPEAHRRLGAVMAIQSFRQRWKRLKKKEG